MGTGVPGCGHFDFAPDDPVCRQIGLGAAALRYQQLGYAVLPLARGAKRPHEMLGGSGGVHWASWQPDAAWYWWGQDPAANIGIATGAPSRLAVIDLDVKHGHDGPAQLQRFLSTQGPHWTIPQGCWVRTPSGGAHVWLRTRAAEHTPERPSILPGVDVKGDGGLVAAPPSMILTIASGGPSDPRSPSVTRVPVPYEHMGGCPCSAPPAPPWLAPWLAQAPPAPASASASGTAAAGGAPDLAQLTRTGIPQGQRNDTMYRLACSLYRRAGISGEAAAWVIEQLRTVWLAGDRSGFGWQEVATIADSARRFVARELAAEQGLWDSYRKWIGA